MTEKLISIIVPVYNSENFLERTVRSILAQTYQNFELLLIDDGSKDSSSQLCDVFAQEDARVKVFHKDNGGISSAQNLGLDEARGDYFTFCDNDDLYHPQYLEILAAALDQSGADIAKGRTESPGMRALENLDFAHYKLDELTLTTFSEPLKNYQDIFIKSVKIWGKTAYYFNEANWCKLYRRELFEQVRFPLDKYAQDVAVVGDLLIQAKKVVDVDAVIYYWIQHSASVTHDKDKRADYKFLEDNLYAGTQGFDRAVKNNIAPFRSYFILATTLRDIKKLADHHDDLIRQIEQDYLRKMPHKMKANILNLLGRIEYVFYERLVHNKK